MGSVLGSSIKFENIISFKSGVLSYVWPCVCAFPFPILHGQS